MKFKFPLSAGIGPLLAFMAGIVYWKTLSVGAYPNESALLIAQVSGVLGMSSAAHPLWVLALKPFQYWGRGDLAQAYNLATLVFGALGVGLCYQVVRNAVVRLVESEGVHSVRLARAAGFWAGLSASLFLAFCMPYWVVSTRASSEPFGILLLLGLTALMQVFTRSQRLIWLMLFAFFYGVCLVESAVLFLFIPFFGVYLLVALWRAQRLETRVILPALLSGGVGLCAYIWVAWSFSKTETARLYEINGLWPAAWEILKMQYRQILQGLPQVGWLLVGLVTIIPWMTALLVGRRGLNEERDWSFYLLHLLMTAVGLAVLFNTGISPWRLLGFGMIVVTPYLLAATYYGYLVAYWFLLPMNWGGALDDRPGLRRLRVGVGVALAVALTGGAGYAVRLNWNEADARPAALINRLAHQVVDDLQGRTWLITAGEIDNNILIAAHDRGVPVELLDQTRGNDSVYRHHIASRIDDVNLKSLAEVSLLAFLQEWMKSGRDISRTVAVFSMPDLWFSAGLDYLPHRTLYLGVETNSPVSPAVMIDAHRSFWKEEIPRLRAAALQPGHASPFSAFVVRHLSMEANNLGVWLEDHHQPEAASEAYARARELDDDNISALLNQYVLAQAGGTFPDREDVIQKVDALVRDGRQKTRVWSLARSYGYVRMPEAFAEIGLSWAVSGYPGMAVSGLRRAIALKGENAPRLKQLLAAVYLAQDQPQESTDLLNEVLAHAPDNRNALFGLARIRIRAGDYVEAGALLTRLEKMGASRERTALEWVQIYLATGEFDRARVQLEELVELNPRNQSAWTLLAALHYSRQDEAGLQACLKQIEQSSQPTFAGLILQGLIAMDRQNLENARRFFEQALVQQPRNSILLGLMLQLDVRMNRPAEAEARVRQLLELDPEHAEANYILGSLQFRRLQVALAEASYRRSLARERKAETLNDLAWLLQTKGAFEEAETLAREALERNPLIATLWDTLGVILRKRGRLAESETALLKAASLNTEQLSIQVHLAELYAAQGARDKVRTLIVRLLERADELDVDDRNALLRLRNENSSPP
jgi:tetratricopeptide (TPR) repeat protein